jgi:MFS family permease
VFGLASVIGPVVGGFFTEHGTVDIGALHVSGWRWIFYINLPLSILALFMIATRMPATRRRPGARIDFLGAALVIVSAGSLMLALSWGGQTYPWSSPVILGLLAAFAAGVAALIAVEARAPEPVLPLGLFRIRAFTTNTCASFLLSMAFMGTVTFMPLYLQVGLGAPATLSGAAILPLMFGLVLTSTGAGRMVSKTGQYKPFMIGGAATMLIGLLLLATMGPHATVGQVAWRMFVMGLGLGPSQSLFSTVAQNAAPPGQLGVVTSAAQFFRQIGSTVGVAVFGALLTGRLASETAGPGGAQESLSKLQALALGGEGGGLVGAGVVHVDPVVRAAFSAAMSGLFLASLAIVVLGLAAIIAIPNIPLRKTHVRAEPVAEPGEGTDNVVG